MSYSSTPVETNRQGESSTSVSIKDQITQAVDVWFVEDKGMVTTSNSVLQGGYDVDLVPGHGAVIGDIIESRTADNYVQAKIVNVVGDTITVNTPWSRDFPAGVQVLLGNPNMNVVGSKVTNRIFRVAPSTVQKVHIQRVILTIHDNNAMDFETFGGAAALASGCVFRTRNSDGTYTNHFNWADNGELINRSYDYDILTKQGGGLHAFVARSSWNGRDKRGVVISLDGSQLEQFEIVVQDDLTSLNYFAAIAQGHIED